MRIIFAGSLGELHEKAVDYVLKTGTIVRTEDGEETTQADMVALVCDTPFAEPRISAKSSYGRMFCDEYSRRLINGYDKDTNFAYDYHSRLFGDDESGADQIQAVIERLAEHPQTRRAVATTWRPCTDICAKDVPCLQLVQFTIRDVNYVDMTAVFRSNDMLSAFGANAYALTQLQQYVAKKIEKAMGKQHECVPVMRAGRYTHIALIPHLYHVRDAEELKRFN